MYFFSDDIKSIIFKKFNSKDITYNDRNSQFLLKKNKIKTGTFPSVNKSLNDVENYHRNSIKEKDIIFFYEYIISMHVERSWIFRKEAINNYNEADYQIKFWGFIFETFFSDNESIVLHWGDTMTSPCKSSKMCFPFLFPTVAKDIRSGIEKIINGLSLVESLVPELRRLHETGQTNKEDSMQRIIDGSSRKKKMNVKILLMIIMNMKMMKEKIMMMIKRSEAAVFGRFFFLLVLFLSIIILLLATCFD
ncbi:hypothetical protein BDF21DRAFT_434161 [Thamnidium elegans]|nr:hypothetical protein BDF21DRAFT_434161 [Thamnidium elegans]